MTGRLYVLNVWHPTTGWVRHQFPTQAKRAAYADHQLLPGSDTRWSDR